MSMQEFENITIAFIYIILLLNILIGLHVWKIKQVMKTHKKAIEDMRENIKACIYAIEVLQKLREEEVDYE